MDNVLLVINFIVNFSSDQTMIKSFEVCDLPVRAAKFVARKNWVITASVSIMDVFEFLLFSIISIIVEE